MLSDASPEAVMKIIFGAGNPFLEISPLAVFPGVITAPQQDELQRIFTDKDIPFQLNTNNLETTIELRLTPYHKAQWVTIGRLAEQYRIKCDKNGVPEETPVCFPGGKWGRAVLLPMMHDIIFSPGWQPKGRRMVKRVSEKGFLRNSFEEIAFLMSSMEIEGEDFSASSTGGGYEISVKKTAYDKHIAPMIAEKSRG